jgi:hypothetical protein
MKKMLLAITILVLASTAPPALAADLQAGWYAHAGGPAVYVDIGVGYPVALDAGRFLTDPGDYGLFTVTGGPYGSTDTADGLLSKHGTTVPIRGNPVGNGL